MVLDFGGAALAVLLPESKENDENFGKNFKIVTLFGDIFSVSARFTDYFNERPIPLFSP